MVQHGVNILEKVQKGRGESKEIFNVLPVATPREPTSSNRCGSRGDSVGVTNTLRAQRHRSPYTPPPPTPTLSPLPALPRSHAKSAQTVPGDVKSEIILRPFRRRKLKGGERVG